jgi:hypothetical protein
MNESYNLRKALPNNSYVKHLKLFFCLSAAFVEAALYSLLFNFLRGLRRHFTPITLRRISKRPTVDKGMLNLVNSTPLLCSPPKGEAAA